MDERTLSLKKRILARIVQCDDPSVLAAVDLVLEEAMGDHLDSTPNTVDAILGEVARALRGPQGEAN